MKSLKKGDLIYLCAPAKAIHKEDVDLALGFLKENGFNVEVSKHCLGQHHYFSGTDEERLSDLQEGLDRDDVKAIWCVRGGYGSIRIVDDLNWNNFLNHPKLIFGYSDITILLQKALSLNTLSIHATAAINLKNNTLEAKQSLIDALKGQPLEYRVEAHPLNISGKASGKIVGGNLSIINSLLPTDLCPSFKNNILFIEEVGEALYHVDRIFYSLKKMGALDEISGLIVGGMTNMTDSDQPFGQSVEEIIRSHIEYRNIPVCFGFPAGHIDDNRALILGKGSSLLVESDSTSFIQA